MNKLAMLILILTLNACANRPDLQPDVYSKGERLLSNGVIDYQNDNFSAAQQNFSNALALYQSVDNLQGVQLSEINLVEILLALSNFAAAEEQLAVLKQKRAKGEIIDPLRDRVIMLESKLLFKKEKYIEALAVIEPLLLRLEQREINDNKRLEVLALAARIEAAMGEEPESKWVSKFRAVLQEEKKFPSRFQVMLKRIDAVKTAQNQQYREALKLLHEALDYYKGQADRSAIAACLEEIAEIEFKQHNYPQALEYLKKALLIRNWLKDRYHIDKIQRTIAQINSVS